MAICWFRSALTIVLAAALGACAAEESRDEKDSADSSDADADSDADTRGTSCASESKSIYVVGSDYALYRFDPPGKSFELVRKLECDTGEATPFSMAVARDGTAYVLYQDILAEESCAGVFPVSIVDGSCGAKTAFECGDSGFRSFGMGYATDNAQTKSEKLYIAEVTGSLGVLDPISGEVTRIGDITGKPEFTGNAAGELWGFFPDTAPAQIARIDKSSGKITLTWPLPELVAVPTSWAFAFWGGSFYLFYQAAKEDSTTVYKVTDGEMEVFMPRTGKHIVGAGVSTCAPVVV